jgi:hypothetical protein
MLSIIIWIIVIIVVIKIIKGLSSNKKEQTDYSKPTYNNYSNNNYSQRSTPVSQKSYCPSCGTKLGKNARFCPSCGGQLDVSSNNIVLSDIFVKGETISLGRKILNLASSNNLIDTFNYSNGIVTIRTQGANIISGPLKGLSVCFSYSGDTELRYITIKYNGNRMKIAAIPEIISDRNYDAIFMILSQAGSVSGLNTLTNEYMFNANKNAKQRNAQISSYWQGYWMSQNLNRWQRRNW